MKSKVVRKLVEAFLVALFYGAVILWFVTGGNHAR